MVTLSNKSRNNRHFIHQVVRFKLLGSVEKRLRKIKSSFYIYLSNHSSIHNLCCQVGLSKDQKLIFQLPKLRQKKFVYSENRTLAPRWYRPYNPGWKKILTYKYRMINKIVKKCSKLGTIKAIYTKDIYFEPTLYPWYFRPR